MVAEPMILKFELGRHLATKLYHPMFNHLEVIVSKKKQTNQPTNQQTNRCH